MNIRILTYEAASNLVKKSIKDIEEKGVRQGWGFMPDAIRTIGTMVLVTNMMESAAFVNKVEPETIYVFDPDHSNIPEQWTDIISHEVLHIVLCRVGEEKAAVDMDGCTWAYPDWDVKHYIPPNPYPFGKPSTEVSR